MLVYVTKSKTVAVADFAAASSACRAHIEKGQSPIPSSRWTGGMILNAEGKAIARVSYNGRVWDPTEWTSEHKPTLLWDPFEAVEA